MKDISQEGQDFLRWVNMKLDELNVREPSFAWVHSILVEAYIKGFDRASLVSSEAMCKALTHE